MEPLQTRCRLKKKSKAKSLNNCVNIIENNNDYKQPSNNANNDDVKWLPW
jgi:hypothetical protein